MNVCPPGELSADEKEKLALSRPRPAYSLPVRIGNWAGDVALIDEKMRVAGYKRDKCQLLTQRSRKMFDNLMRSMELAVEGPVLLYGPLYQIQACELPSTPELGTGKTSTGLNLAGYLNESDLEMSSHFTHGCGLSGSPEKLPCVRNTFAFVGCDGPQDGLQVNYGEEFYIRISESGIDTPLYLQCENATMDNFGAHLPVRLSQSPDCYCRFRMFHWNPDVKDDLLETAIPSNTRVLINHLSSGRNLACEYGNWFPTFFGAECGISCHNFRDTHRMDTGENMWKIVGTVKPDMNMYVRAAKGEDIPDELLT